MRQRHSYILLPDGTRFVLSPWNISTMPALARAQYHEQIINALLAEVKRLESELHRATFREDMGK